jgi:3'-5' exoribonuclease-like protein
MRFSIDTEFYERPGRIELISIGIVAEDGREYYAENSLFDWRYFDPEGLFEVTATQKWLWENVRPYLNPETRQLPLNIAQEIIEFVGYEQDGPKPEFWGYYCDYDWVVFCWLFGRMLDLPEGFPMYCKDLMQELDRLGLQGADLDLSQGQEHNALDDARWVMEAVTLVHDL